MLLLLQVRNSHGKVVGCKMFCPGCYTNTLSYQLRGGRVAADVRAELISCWPLNCTSITLAGSPASPV